MAVTPSWHIATLSPRTTRSISPENFSGQPGQGGRATEGTGAMCARDLGPGWKISPSVDLPAGETLTLADIDGAGIITHVWITTHTDNWRTLILRAYWDSSEEPAVEVPYGDFFCNGWGRFCQVSSQMIAANPHGGFNSYWPMPFRSHAKLTIENTSSVSVRLYYQVTYEELPSPQEDLAYFHAQWRRSNPLEEKVPHTILDDIAGSGQYVGTYIAWGVNSPGWWGEGEIKFYLDSDLDEPVETGIRRFAGREQRTISAARGTLMSPEKGTRHIPHPILAYHRLSAPMDYMTPSSVLECIAGTFQTQSSSAGAFTSISRLLDGGPDGVTCHYVTTSHRPHIST